MENLVNEYRTVLNGGIDSVQTTIIVAAAPPAALSGGNFRLRLGPADSLTPEYILVGTVSGTTLSGCTRHVEGSATSAWPSGTLTAAVVTVAGLNDRIASLGGGLPSQWIAPTSTKVQGAYSMGDGASVELETGDGISGGGTGYLRGGDGPEDGGSAFVRGGKGTDNPNSAIGGEVKVGGGSVGSAGSVTVTAGYDPVTSNAGGFIQGHGGSSAGGGDANFTAGDAGTVGLPGGNAVVKGGSASNSNDAPGRIDLFGGDGNGVDGYVAITTKSVTLDILAGTASPAAGAGVAAGLGSQYHRTNGAAGELWYKTGASDTAWTKIV